MADAINPTQHCPQCGNEFDTQPLGDKPSVAEVLANIPPSHVLRSLIAQSMREQTILRSLLLVSEKLEREKARRAEIVALERSAG